MRLIDIDSDEYSSYLYYPYNYEVGDYEKFMVITDDDVQSLPTVDAIPIAFIRKWVLAQGYGRKQGWFITLRNFEKLFKDWEAENEID